MLRVTVADRPEDLLDLLVDGLTAGPVDPFAADWVTVPNLGMRNWLQQQLSQRLGAGASRDGVAANIEFPSPGALRWRVLDAYREQQGGDPDQVDPWQVDRLVWTILELISDPDSTLDRRLLTRPDGGTLAGRAAPIAELFDRYAVHRPAMLLEWLANRNVGPDGAQLDPSRTWQPELFRAVRDRIAERYGVAETSSQRLATALELIRSGELSLDAGARPLPQRLFVFGQSVLPAELGPVLHAIATTRPVSLLLLSPSATATHRLAVEQAAQPPVLADGVASWAFPRPAHVLDSHVAHPLLSAWGVRPLDSGLLLGAAGILPEVARVDDPLPVTLLARLQQDLRADVVDGPQFVPQPGDTSVQVHAAPGATRQVEVLRDVLLGLLRDDPTLRESDIAVVCPQLEQLGPIVTAVFGQSAQRDEQPEEGRVPSLRYSLVDRSARSFNPVMDAMAQLFELLPGRFDVPSVRSFLALPAVRERFGLSGDDLGLLSDMAEYAGVRWGIDGAHRAGWNIDASHHANSWAAGVEQLMMGIALGDDLRDALPPGGAPDPAAGHDFSLGIGAVAVMPLDDGSIAAAGRVAAAVSNIEAVYRRLQSGGERTVAEWADDLLWAADQVVATPWGEDWQRLKFDAAVLALRDASAPGDGSPSELPLRFSEVRRLLSPSLDGGAARADLGAGAMVVSRPSLLGNVPYRVVCILGLDADALPVGRAGGDDLMATAVAVGDRDPRSDARADLLAAVGAAREHLVVTATSRDVRTNVPVPMAVVLDELLELVARTRRESAEDLSQGPSPVCVDHPRQPFAPTNFTAADGAEPFGFDPVMVGAAEVLRGDRPVGVAGGPHVLVTEPIAVDLPDPVELTKLRSFFWHPVKSFLKDRLNVVVPSAGEERADELPTSLSNLDRARIESAVLQALVEQPTAPLPAADPAAVAPILDSARARGVLPPEDAAKVELDALFGEVGQMVALAEQANVRRPAETAHPVDVTLAPGVRIVGAVVGCVDGNEPGPVRLKGSRMSASLRLELAIDLLCLTAQDPSQQWTGVAVARNPDPSQTTPVMLRLQVKGASPSEREEHARAALRSLVEQYHDGLGLALPLFAKTSWAVYKKPTDSTTWKTGGGDYDKEDLDPYHVRAFGFLDFEDLTELDVAGHTLLDEAHRLWDAVTSAVVDLTEQEAADV